MRADVAEDAAVLLGIPEPVGPAGAAAGVAVLLGDLVGRDVDGLDHLADGALLDQFAGVDRGLHFEALAVHDGVDALGFGDGLADFGKLLERGDAGLVGEKVLAVLHHADAERRALVGDLRAQHELRGGIVEDLVLGLDDFRVGKALGECGEFVFFAAPYRNQFAAAALDRADHAVDMVVAHAADGELDVVLGRFVLLLGKDGVFDDGLGAGAKWRKAGHHGDRTYPGTFEEIAPAPRLDNSSVLLAVDVCNSVHRCGVTKATAGPSTSTAAATCAQMTKVSVIP